MAPAPTTPTASAAPFLYPKLFIPLLAIGIRPLAPDGMRGSASARLAATRASQTKTGKRVVGGAAAMGMMGMANRRDPVSSYNPRRPVMPVPQNGRPM